MARRLVLNVQKKEMKFSDLQTFYRQAAKQGVEGSASIDVTVERGKVLFGVRLPDDRIATGEKVRVRKVTKKKKAAEKQIEDHKEKKENGQKEAYVPPVGKKSPPKPPKVKCPVCNVRKAIVRAGSVATIKPHVVKGEPCDGGGTQVVKKGRTWQVPETN